MPFIVHLLFAANTNDAIAAVLILSVLFKEYVLKIVPHSGTQQLVLSRYVHKGNSAQ